jgi:lycopene beta-cyclase
MPDSAPFDYLLIGGGLQNALIALALLEHRPGVRFAIIERESRLGGNHLWCFHQRDVPASARVFVDPLVAYRWPAYEVRFPNLTRRLAIEYAGITSEQLHKVVTERVAAAPGAALYHSAAVASVSANAVTLEDGRTIAGDLVIDSRGPEKLVASHRVAYQKFLGLEVALAVPRPDFVPRLMDATVPQNDGYRFIYALPLTPDRFMVEDTYYSDGPSLDREGLRREILAYAQRIGLEVASVEREEVGVLPLTTRAESSPVRDGILVGGYAGGWFHATTGYSFPVALRLAMHVALHDRSEILGEDWRRLIARRESQARFFNLLNRMLFGAIAPEKRWNVFERFYRLPEATIERFYAMDVTITDRLRLVVGRPPAGISLRSALAEAFGKQAWMR